MNVVVFGAGGKTGSLVVERAVAAGHTVTVFVHDASKPQPAGVRVVPAMRKIPVRSVTQFVGRKR